MCTRTLRHHERPRVPTGSPAALLPHCERVLRENPLHAWPPGAPLRGVRLWGCAGRLRKLLVVASILHFKQLHSPTNFLIASLACADFLVGVTVMPFSMLRSVESCWYFGTSFCTFHTCCDVAFCYSSLFHLCFISVDRCMAVTDPLVYPTKFTGSVSGICIAVSWTLSLVYFGTMIYTGVNDDGMESLVSALNCVGGCQIVINQDWVLIDFLLFFIPTLVMIILYSKIFLVAKQQAIKIESTMDASSESVSERYNARVGKRE